MTGSRLSRTGWHWLLGAACGAVAGFGVLEGGPLVDVIAVGMLAVLASIPDRDSSVGGFMVAFGVAWLLVFGRATASCGADCTAPT
jgi:hypothetical protein